MIKCEVDKKTKRMNIQAEGSTAQLLTEITYILEAVYKNLDDAEKETFRNHYNGVMCPFVDKKDAMIKGLENILDKMFDKIKEENEDGKIGIHAVKVDKDSDIGKMIEKIMKKMEADADDE